MRAQLIPFDFERDFLRVRDFLSQPIAITVTP